MIDLAEFLLARIAEDEADALDFRDSGEPGWWTYERMRAECTSKRRIVDWLAPIAEATSWDGDIGLTLRLLALPYADHEDYREGWKP